MSQTRRVARAPVTAAAAVVLAVTRAARVLAQARGRVLRAEAQRRTSVGRKDSSRRISANLGESRRISANLAHRHDKRREGRSDGAAAEAAALVGRQRQAERVVLCGGGRAYWNGDWRTHCCPSLAREARARDERADEEESGQERSAGGGPGREGSRENCSVARRCSSSSD